jgi:hypothetical protein
MTVTSVIISLLRYHVSPLSSLTSKCYNYANLIVSIAMLSNYHILDNYSLFAKRRSSGQDENRLNTYRQDW